MCRLAAMWSDKGSLWKTDRYRTVEATNASQLRGWWVIKQKGGTGETPTLRVYRWPLEKVRRFFRRPFRPKANHTQSGLGSLQVAEKVSVSTVHKPSMHRHMRSK